MSYGWKKRSRQIQSTGAVIVPDENNATSAHPSHSHTLFLRQSRGDSLLFCSYCDPSKVRFQTRLGVFCSHVWCFKVRFSSHPPPPSAFINRISTTERSQQPQWLTHDEQSYPKWIECVICKRGGKLTWSVSVKNETLSRFMTDIPSERRQSCQLLRGSRCST